MISHDPTVEEYEKLVSAGKVLVDFWASWCGPCRAQAPIAEELANTTEVNLIKIDVDKGSPLCDRFEVYSIPTLLFYDGGELIGKKVGLTSLDALKAAFKL